MMNLSAHSNSLGESSHHRLGSKALNLSKHSGSIGSSSHHAREANPIKSDAELLLLKGKVDKIQKYKTFQRWKGKFLTRFDTFLYDKGMDPAEKSATDLDKNLTKLVNQTEKVLDYIHKGDLGADKKTVKASLALNEMCNQLEQIRQEIESIVPSLKSDERVRGYSKFHLGAALIRQGFHQYSSMKLLEDHVREIGTALQDVADKQQHDLFYQYKNQVTRFCDVMADLDLYDIMLKCVQFAQPPDESESEEMLPIVVIVQLLETPRIIFQDGEYNDVKSDGNDDPFDGNETDDLIVEKTEIEIEVEENESVKIVRENIRIAFEIPTERQIVKFHSKVLDDETKTIDQLGIREGAVLTVQRVMIPIFVHNKSRREMTEMKLRVDPDISVSDLKRDLEPRTDIPAPNQDLYKHSGGTLLDDATKMLSSYGVVPNTVLDLEPRHITIYVDMPDDSGRHEFVIAPREERTKGLKEKIEVTTGIVTSRQVLSFDGQELPLGDGDCPAPCAKEMGLHDGDVLSLNIFKIPLTVSNWNGQVHDVMVEPSETVADLKKKLEDPSGIVASNQKLRKGGVDLNSDTESQTIAALGMKSGDQLDLEPKVINVHVESPDGKLHEVALAPSDTTDEIKRKIEKTTDISVSRQVLSVNGKELHPNCSLKDIGIQEGETIVVEILKIPVKVQMWDGTKTDLMADPTESLLETKQLIDLLNPGAGLAPDNQSLFFQDKTMDEDSKPLLAYGVEPNTVLYLEPKTILVNVETPSRSVHQIYLVLSDQTPDIKQKSQSATHIAAKRQLLKHKGEKLPDDGITVKDMGLKHGSHLVIEIFKINVKVETWDGKTIDLMVDPSQPVIDIKDLAEPESGVPPSNQALYFQSTALDDNKPLEEYEVSAGSVLRLEPKTVNVEVTMPDGQPFFVLLSPSDDDKAIKGKIEAATGMPALSQVVKYNDKTVTPDDTVRSLEIWEGRALSVELYKIPIIVNTWDGKTINLEVDPMECIENTKKLLEPESGIAASNQTLNFENKCLTDDKRSLHSCGIVPQSTLYLEPNVVNVNVLGPSGTKQTVVLAPSDDMIAIKSKLEAVTDIAAYRQVVKFNNAKLPTGDDKTVKEMGIREGSELVVDVSTIPITINTWDGKSFDVNIDPTKPLSDLKDELANKTLIAADNQVLLHGDIALTKNDTSIMDNGINENDVLFVEPALLNVNVVLPDEKVHQITISPAHDCKTIKGKIADVSGLAMSRQVLKKDGSYLPTGKPAKEMGVVDGSTLQVEILRFPVLVNTPTNGHQIKIMVEPCGSLSDLKKLLESETGIKPKLQVLTKVEGEGNELVGEMKSMVELGLHPGVVVNLKRKDDYIVIVDIKYGTLFGIDRDRALSLGVVTLKGANGTADFVEATADARDKELMKQAMLDSPRLGVKPHIVIEKIDVEEYDVQEAEAVKGKWGVQLKKTQKNKRGNELLFVDIKHGVFGFLDRKKMENEVKVITPVGTGKEATLEEAEKDAQKYDKFVKEIRTIFGVASL
jgi:hypothetical protein